MDAIGVRCQILHYRVKYFNMNLRGVKNEIFVDFCSGTISLSLVVERSDGEV